MKPAPLEGGVISAGLSALMQGRVVAPGSQNCHDMAASTAFSLGPCLTLGCFTCLGLDQQGSEQWVAPHLPRGGCG